MAQRLLVNSPPVAAPRWPDLLSSAEVIEPEIHWQLGLRFQPPPPNFNTLAPISPVNCNTGSFNIDGSNPDHATVINEDPLFYWDAFRCSTFGSTVTENNARAATKLSESISHKMEKEFWTGAAHISTATSGQYLTDNTATILNSGTATGLAFAMARLQYSWGNCSQGAQAMIHMTPYVASLMVSARMVFQDGNKLVDTFGNIVVAGTGYDGSPASHTADASLATSWMFATYPVQVLLGTPGFVVPNEDRIDYRNNVDVAIAYQAGAVIFDPSCTQAINVAVTSPCS